MDVEQLIAGFAAIANPTNADGILSDDFMRYVVGVDVQDELCRLVWQHGNVGGLRAFLAAPARRDKDAEARARLVDSPGGVRSARLLPLDFALVASMNEIDDLGRDDEAAEKMALLLDYGADPSLVALGALADDALLKMLNTPLQDKADGDDDDDPADPELVLTRVDALETQDGNGADIGINLDRRSRALGILLFARTFRTELMLNRPDDDLYSRFSRCPSLCGIKQIPTSDQPRAATFLLSLARHGIRVSQLDRVASMAIIDTLWGEALRRDWGIAPTPGNLEVLGKLTLLLPKP